MKKIKIFLASSGELEEDRKEITLFLYRENKSLIDKDIFLDPVVWEELLHSFREERIQNYFNEEMLKCDIVIALFHKKVGQFTYEEFELAYKNLREGNKPHYLFVYFKGGDIPIEEINTEDIKKINQLKETIEKYGQIYTTFNSIQELIINLKRQFKIISSNLTGSNALKGKREDIDIESDVNMQRGNLTGLWRGVATYIMACDNISLDRIHSERKSNLNSNIEKIDELIWPSDVPWYIYRPPEDHGIEIELKNQKLSKEWITKQHKFFFELNQNKNSQNEIIITGNITREETIINGKPKDNKTDYTVQGDFLESDTVNLRIEIDSTDFNYAEAMLHYHG